MRGGSHIWGSPLISRKISWDRREAQRRMQHPAWGRQDRLRSTQMVWATALWAPVWDGVYTQGHTLVLGAGINGWSEEFHNQECSWRKPALPRKQSAIVEWCAKSRAAVEASPLIHWPLLPQGTREGSVQGGLWVPGHHCFWPLPIWATQSPW